MGLATLSIVAATLIWASMGVFVKSIDLNATTLALIRTGVPTTTFLLVFLFKGRLKSLLFKDNPYLYLASFVNGLSFFMYFNGFLLTSVGTAIITLYTWPLLVPVIARLLIKEAISKRVYGALAVAFAGMVLVVSGTEDDGTSSDFFGVLMMAGASVINAVFVVLMKKGSVKVGAFESVFYQNAAGFLLYAILIWFLPEPEASLSKVGIAVAYNFVLGVVGFTFFFYSLRRLPINIASLLTFAEVAFAVLMGVLLLGEPLSAAKLFGMLLIVIPCMSVAYSRKSSELPSKTASGWEAKKT